MVSLRLYAGFYPSLSIDREEKFQKSMDFSVSCGIMRPIDESEYIYLLRQEVVPMKKLTHRALSALLALTLALSLAVPALAVEPVRVTGVSLSRTEAVLAPGETLTLNAAVAPANATVPDVLWDSSRPGVATVKDGAVTAVSAGTADITAITVDGSFRAVCKVTVADKTDTALTLLPSESETLSVGDTLQLEVRTSGSAGATITWSSGNAAVATVSAQGLVTALAPGRANIMAMSDAVTADGSPVYKTCTVTVQEKAQTVDTSGDKLFLSKTAEKRQGGLYHTITLSAPPASVVRSGADVTKEYDLSWSWTDPRGAILSTEQTLSQSLQSREDVTVTCTVTATRKNDSGKTPMQGSCVYTVQVLPGTVVSATLDVGAGATPLASLMNSDKTLSVIDQLVKGGGNAVTPAIAGLVDVSFDPDNASGEAGALNVAEGQLYSVADNAQVKLGDVIFTPVSAGTYIIPFTAYGTETYFGQLEVVVTGEKPANPAPAADPAATPAEPASATDPATPAAEPAPASDMTCGSSGVTFAGSDFFRSGDTDPVVSLTFGRPTSGKLLRDVEFGSGVTEDGARYYTNSARDGDYHVSTLTYLPAAGFNGLASIPIQTVTRSGKTANGSLTILVRGKNVSDTFTDVNPNTCGLWAGDAVDFAHDFGLVNGTSAATFSPDASMTRAMLVTVLYRAAGSPNVTVTSRFRDLDTGSYYYKAVVWANAMGIVTGTSDTTFSPDSPVTRQQIAVILYRYAALTGQNDGGRGANLNAFSDRRLVANYASQGVRWAVGKGIITGTTATTLSPEDPATRAQVVVILHRYLAN